MRGKWHFCNGRIKNTKRLMDKKRLFYEAPEAQTVELCHENAMMQTLSATMPNYGHWITEGTDGWEDFV